MLPSEEDIASYQEHGFYKSKKIFTDDEIDRAVEAQENFYKGRQDLNAKITGLGKYTPQGHPGNTLGKNDYSSFFNAELSRLTRNPVIAAIACHLTKTNSIRLWHDQLLYKPSSKSGSKINIGWHTDRQYWQVCSSDKMITAWIPFHDCDENMGTINVIKGSHNWPLQSDDLDFFLRNTDNEPLEKQFITGGNEIVKPPVNLKKGEVSFHHCKIIHGSGPNMNDKPRRAIAVHMQDHDNRYVLKKKPDGTNFSHSIVELLNLSKTDKEPDFKNPILCPTLYEKIIDI